MARPFWKGAINFGLVHIPVRMYKAASQKDIRFRELHDADGAPLKQKRVCSVDGKEVDYNHVVKGFEISPSRFVLVKPSELEALEEKLPQNIDIEHFVDLGEIDPLYFKQSYYIVPEANSSRAYGLLLSAMRESNRAAVARITIRMKQHLAALRASGDSIALSTLYYHDEVLPQEEIEELPREAKLDKRELMVAKQLIEALSTHFDPKAYEDKYRARVLEMIERKAAGQEIVGEPEQPRSARVVDLMAALEASLAQSARGAKKPKTKAGAGKSQREQPRRRRAA